MVLDTRHARLSLLPKIHFYQQDPHLTFEIKLLNNKYMYLIIIGKKK